MLLLQGRGEMAVLPAVSADLLHHMLWIHGVIVMLLVQGRGEIVVLPAVTAVLLHHSALDTWTDLNFFITV